MVNTNFTKRNVSVDINNCERIDFDYDDIIGMNTEYIVYTNKDQIYVYCILDY